MQIPTTNSIHLSPTKIKQPCAPSGRASQEQISEEVISPVLEVNLQTPEKGKPQEEKEEEGSDSEKHEAKKQLQEKEDDEIAQLSMQKTGGDLGDSK